MNTKKQRVLCMFCYNFTDDFKGVGNVNDISHKKFWCPTCKKFLYVRIDRVEQVENDE